MKSAWYKDDCVYEWHVALSAHCCTTNKQSGLIKVYSWSELSWLRARCTWAAGRATGRFFPSYKSVNNNLLTLSPNNHQVHYQTLKKLYKPQQHALSGEITPLDPSLSAQIPLWLMVWLEITLIWLLIAVHLHFFFSVFARADAQMAASGDRSQARGHCSVETETIQATWIQTQSVPSRGLMWIKIWKELICKWIWKSLNSSQMLWF